MHRLHDNPTPYEFPISVLGARPQVAVKLDTMPSAEVPVDAAAAANLHASSSGAAGGARRTSEAGSSLAKSTAKQPPKGGKVADYTVKFDRLLLNKRDTQAFTISNTGVLPFKWRLAGAAQLPPEFKVSPSEGQLAARSKLQVTVEFNAIKKQELHELVTLEVSPLTDDCVLDLALLVGGDVDASCHATMFCTAAAALPQVLDVAEVLGVSKAVPIAIRGEAYDIHIDLKFPQDSFPGVDFGAMRVVDDCAKQIGLRNTEKYDVKFAFAIASEEARALVTITPDSGIVPPGKEVAVAVSLLFVFLRPRDCASDPGSSQANTHLFTSLSLAAHNRCTGTRT